MSGDAVTLTQEDSTVVYLVGDDKICTKPLPPYSEEICGFLSDLSQSLVGYQESKNNTDVSAFGFWCRKRNIDNLRKRYTDGAVRLGRGLVFHITPANVPINFAYSFVFGLLAGNANIVRVPTEEFSQVDIICNAISELFDTGRYSEIAQMNAFVRYESTESTTKNISKICDGRIIWGGDETINNIRRFPIPAHSVEITFADRYSLCLMNSEFVSTLTTQDLKILARQFYNDTYFLDQNACSTPHLVVWIGAGNEKAKEKFWLAVREQVRSSYSLDIGISYKKYSQVCRDAIGFPCIKDVTRYHNHLYRLAIDELPSNVDNLRGQFGYFFEYDTDDICSLVHVVNEKYQTLTYFGIDEAILRQFVVDNRLSGIDRIVPIGRALDIDVIWDGYDIVKTLSRVISGIV